MEIQRGHHFRSNKYGAKGVWYHVGQETIVNPAILAPSTVEKLKEQELLIYFDSQLEFKVWQVLRQKYPSHSIIRQYAAQIIEPCDCYPKGKIHHIDFGVIEPGRKRNPLTVFYEAKGVLTRIYPDILALLELNQPRIFRNMHLVFEKQIPTKYKLIKNLQKTDFSSRLMTLETLNKKLVDSQ